jgi:hypothetical protein
MEDLLSLLCSRRSPDRSTGRATRWSNSPALHPQVLLVHQFGRTVTLLLALPDHLARAPRSFLTAQSLMIEDRK